MSGDEKDGGPAYPTGEHDEATGAYHNMHGMSLRDWFAGQAMQALAHKFSADDAILCARRSYTIADAMLTERAKGLK